MFNLSVCLFIVFAAFTPVALHAVDPGDEVRDEIKSLDAGPAQQPENPGQAMELSLKHLQKQEAVLRKFLKSFPQHSFAWEAKLRLARLLNLRAKLKNEAPSPEADLLLAEVETNPDEAAQREVQFTRLAQKMRRWQGKRVPPSDRHGLLEAARKFQEKNPADKRVAPLLLEISKLFENQPQIHQKLVRDVLILAKDPEVRREAEDDLRRAGLLNTPLKFTSQNHRRAAFDLQQWKGTPVLMIFFAMNDPVSVAATKRTLSETSIHHKNLRILLVSLDSKCPDPATIGLPKNSGAEIVCDQRGWESPVIRNLGINAIPTVWLIDQNGILRSLDPLDNFEAALRSLK